MKRKSKILGIVAMILAMIGTLVTTVSAKAIGADYTIQGFPAGGVIVIFAAIIGALFAFGVLKMPEAVGIKPIVGIVAIMLVIGLGMIFIETPTPKAEVTGLADMEFSIEASAITTAGSYYPDTSFDDSSNLFTVPYKANTTSSLLNEHGDNSTYSDDPRLNFTIRADFPADADDDDLAIIYYEILNPTLYTESDADNYVLVKTDDVHQAVWTDQDGSTSDVLGWTAGGIEETLTLSLDLELYETGLQLADVFNGVVMNIKFHNQANTWSETYQIYFVCTESWAYA